MFSKSTHRVIFLLFFFLENILHTSLTPEKSFLLTLQFFKKIIKQIRKDHYYHSIFGDLGMWTDFQLGSFRG